MFAKDIFQFTHGRDLDGISCAILGSFIYYGFERKHDVSYEDYHTINDSIKKFITDERYKNYDLILITDMGITKEVADLIDEVCAKEGTERFILIDHHDTNEFLNEYHWASVTARDEFGDKISATKLMVQAYEELFPTKYVPILKQYADLVSDYDTYVWKEKNNWQAKKMHDICSMYSLLIFKDLMTKRLLNLESFFSEEEEFSWKLDRKKCKEYIDLKMSQVKIIPVKGYKVAFMFSDVKEYVSELGNYVCEQLDVDIAAMADMGRKEMSYRSISDNFHLGKDFAAMFGGGGHDKSAGSQITGTVIENIIGQIFE